MPTVYQTVLTAIVGRIHQLGRVSAISEAWNGGGNAVSVVPVKHRTATRADSD